MELVKTIDRRLRNARRGAGGLARQASHGRIDRALTMLASQPVSIAGPDLDLLFVTSAREGLPQDVLLNESGAGDIFVCKIGVAGLPDQRCVLDR